MAAYRTEFNEQVNQWRQEHIKQYEAPKTENIIVGFSGIDPDKKWVEESAKNELIDFVKENIQNLSEQAMRDIAAQAIAEAESDLPEAAADEEFDEMLDEVFENGTEPDAPEPTEPEPSSPTEPTEPEPTGPEQGGNDTGDDGAEAATDEEFNEMLSEVFGN